MLINTGLLTAFLPFFRVRTAMWVKKLNDNEDRKLFIQDISGIVELEQGLRFQRIVR